MSLLSVRDIRASYGKVMALQGVTLNVGRGELVCLVGANGAGKTTLMKVIMGLVPAATGTVELEGRPLLGMRTHDIARLGIAYVPEGRGTLRELSVRENLRLGAFSRRWDTETRGDLGGCSSAFPSSPSASIRPLERFRVASSRCSSLGGRSCRVRNSCCSTSLRSVSRH